MNLRVSALLCFVLLLNACASPTGRRENTWPFPQPPVVKPPPTAVPPPAQSLPPVPIIPPPSPVQSYPRSAEAISGQAVVSLMRQASAARSQGQFELAASQLERAQRIEPRNYFVWSALARVYLDQEQYDQAISVAGKSNSLARGNLFVEVENWKTIASARRAQGDSAGALQAQALVEEIERVLGGG